MTIDEKKLAQAIEQRHGCRARMVGSEMIDVSLHDQPDWDGSVAIFAVDHPETDLCYAWSMPFDVSGLPWQAQGAVPEAIFAVLKQPPVDSAVDAWRHVDVAVSKLSENELSITPIKGS